MLNTGGLAKRTRNSRACRRCRRLRTKCLNDGGQPPCQSCRQTNQECTFLRRGEPDTDREFRRSRVSTAAHPSAIIPPWPIVQAVSPHAQESTPGWDWLPPFEELLEGIQIFTTSFFQLGFVPKTLFFERLRKEPASVNVFLLLSILSISARFTTSLVKRYGGTSAATDLFLGRATALVFEQMYIPSLEATQGLFLMSIAEWGKGDKHRSSMHMGIAVTMAGILRLHREETYQLSETGTAEEFVHAEAARRTFWMLESYNSLLSGSSSPVSISYRDISALLPCSEAEFAFGSTTGPRAAMAGTLPTLANPALVHCPSRSLFATLLQTHSLWGRVARFVGRDDENFLQNWQVRRDEYMEVLTALNEFESNIPPLQRWSTWNLRGFKAEGLDLAYFSAVMALRLSYIVLGRRYLHDQNQSNGIPCTGEQSTITTADLFQNMLVLHEQIDAFFDFRLTDQGFPALIVFCIYVCGSLANHLHQEPHIFPSIAPRAEEILRKSLTGLGQLQDAWPLARKWNSSLCRATATARIPMHRVIDTIQDGRGSDNTNDLLLPLDSDALPDNTSPGDVVRLNDPFPSDVMLLEFETYPWNDIFTGMADPPLSNIL